MCSGVVAALDLTAVSSAVASTFQEFFSPSNADREKVARYGAVFARRMSVAPHTPPKAQRRLHPSTHPSPSSLRRGAICHVSLFTAAADGFWTAFGGRLDDVHSNGRTRCGSGRRSRIVPSFLVLQRRERGHQRSRGRGPLRPWSPPPAPATTQLTMRRMCWVAWIPSICRPLKSIGARFLSAHDAHRLVREMRSTPR